MRLWPPQKEAVTEEFFRLTSIWVLSSDDFDLGQIESSDHFGGGGAGGHDNGEDNDPDSIPLIFTPEQIAYAQDLDRKAASLSRSIQDLRLRLPPPDISQRLPHLHAHSLASNAALALQLNAHSATKEQVQLREIRLQEENVEYDKAISNCENKIREKLQEANAFQSKLKELDFTEKKLKFELESVQAALIANQSEQSNKLSVEIKSPNEAQEEAKDAKSALLYKLENKKQELASIEEMVQNLEKQWAKVQDDAVKKPSPGPKRLCPIIFEKDGDCGTTGPQDCLLEGNQDYPPWFLLQNCTCSASSSGINISNCSCKILCDDTNY